VASASQHCSVTYNSFCGTFWTINNVSLYTLQLAPYDFHLLKTKNITERISLNVYKQRKRKAVPLQAWTGPEGSRKDIWAYEGAVEGEWRKLRK